jgi:hypothetical protein
MVEPAGLLGVADPKQGEAVIEVLAPASREAADQGWKAFFADTEFRAVARRSCFQGFRKTLLRWAGNIPTRSSTLGEFAFICVHRLSVHVTRTSAET